MQQTINRSSVSTSKLSTKTEAVSLLQLLSRVEACAVAPRDNVSELAISLVMSVTEPLTPYQDELLTTFAEAIFSSANDDFYGAYRGYNRANIFEIVVGKEDLRPLAYRALTCSENEIFSLAPRFSQALLLLQKHWDADFLQLYKDVAGNLSAYSIKRRQLDLGWSGQ